MVQRCWNEAGNQPLRGATRGRFIALSTAATKGGAASGTAVTAMPQGVGTACQQVLQRPEAQTSSEEDEDRRSFLTTPRTGIRTAVPRGTRGQYNQSAQIAGEYHRFVHSLREMCGDLRTGTYQRVPLINVRSRPPLTLRPWNSGCEGKGHKQTWQHVSCGPSLRSVSPLRFEDVLVGIADGFVPVAGAPSPRCARHAHSLRSEKMSRCARRPVSTGGRPGGRTNEVWGRRPLNLRWTAQSQQSWHGRKQESERSSGPCAFHAASTRDYAQRSRQCAVHHPPSVSPTPQPRSTHV